MGAEGFGNRMCSLESIAKEVWQTNWLCICFVLLVLSKHCHLFADYSYSSLHVKSSNGQFDGFLYWFWLFFFLLNIVGMGKGFLILLQGNVFALILHLICKLGRKNCVYSFEMVAFSQFSKSRWLCIIISIQVPPANMPPCIFILEQALSARALQEMLSSHNELSDVRFWSHLKTFFSFLFDFLK